MHYNYLFMVCIVLVIGCSSLPFDASNGNAKIASDLQMPSDAISLSSRCRFFPVQYGPQWPVNMQECVFIKTKDAFDILGYDKQRKVYISKYRITFAAMQCAVYISDGLSRGMLHLNTNEYTFPLMLLRHDSDRLNQVAVDEVLAALRTNNIRIIMDVGPPVAGYFVYKTVVRNPCRTDIAIRAIYVCLFRRTERGRFRGRHRCWRLGCQGKQGRLIYPHFLFMRPNTAADRK